MYKIHIVNTESGDTELLMPFEGDVLSIAKTILAPAAKTTDVDWGVIVDGIVNEKLAPFWDEIELLAKNLQKLSESDVDGAVMSMLSQLAKEVDALEKWANVHAKDEREQAAKEAAMAEAEAKSAEKSRSFGKPTKSQVKRYEMQNGKRTRSAATQAIYDKYPSTQLKRADYGKYCRNCATQLDGKTKPIFCSRKCAAQWRSKHKGTLATPRYTLEPAAFTHTITAGVGVESPDYAPANA